MLAPSLDVEGKMKLPDSLLFSFAQWREGEINTTELAADITVFVKQREQAAWDAAIEGVQYCCITDYGSRILDGHAQYPTIDAWRSSEEYKMILDPEPEKRIETVDDLKKLLAEMDIKLPVNEIDLKAALEELKRKAKKEDERR